MSSVSECPSARKCPDAESPLARSFDFNTHTSSEESTCLRLHFALVSGIQVVLREAISVLLARAEACVLPASVRIVSASLTKTEAREQV